jgi:hypothetical protein
MLPDILRLQRTSAGHVAVTALFWAETEQSHAIDIVFSFFESYISRAIDIFGKRAREAEHNYPMRSSRWCLRDISRAVDISRKRARGAEHAGAEWTVWDIYPEPLTDP